MRLHNRGAGLRRRLEVLKPGVIGGLLALLMLVAAACDDKAQPAGPTATGESPGTGAQTQQIPSTPPYIGRGHATGIQGLRERLHLPGPGADPYTGPDDADGHTVLKHYSHPLPNRKPFGGGCGLPRSAAARTASIRRGLAGRRGACERRSRPAAALGTSRG